MLYCCLPLTVNRTRDLLNPETTLFYGETQCSLKCVRQKLPSLLVSVPALCMNSVENFQSVLVSVPALCKNSDFHQQLIA